MEKIEELTIRKYGLHGFEITIPKIWIHDNELNEGDKVDIFREGNTLIIKPKGKLHKFIDEQKKEKAEVAGK